MFNQLGVGSTPSPKLDFNSMIMSKKCTVLAVFLALSLITGGDAFPWSGDEFQNRTARQRSCVENHEYPHNGFCCLNCDAGTYVSKKCIKDSKKGTCFPCEPGTYAEHPTGMEQCLQCTQCHMDQIMTKPCTSMMNTQCECKAGFFCLPDQPCEVCKKCSKCKPGEEEIKKCTSTSNTKCAKRAPSPPSPPSPRNPTTAPTPTPAPSNTNIPAIVVPVFLIAFLIAAVGWCLWKKRLWQRPEISVTESPCASIEDVKIPISQDEVCVPSPEERQNNQNAGLEEGEEPRPESRPLLQETQGVGTKGSALEDEDRGLGDSLPNTTSSSQTSLSALPTMVSTGDSPHHSPLTPRPGEREAEPWARDDGPPRRLIPLLGEELSLSKSFDFFDTFLDVRFHNKFFRSIGVSDNAIKVAETNHAVDKVYELLRVWMQREGLRANINDLLRALLELDQRYSAENIASKAVEKGFYRYDER